MLLCPRTLQAGSLWYITQQHRISRVSKRLRLAFCDSYWPYSIFLTAQRLPRITLGSSCQMVSTMTVGTRIALSPPQKRGYWVKINRSDKTSCVGSTT
jgi:hypothetical protein